MNLREKRREIIEKINKGGLSQDQVNKLIEEKRKIVKMMNNGESEDIFKDKPEEVVNQTEEYSEEE